MGRGDGIDGERRGVVLAGGHSRRFGEADKALGRIEGTPLVDRATAAVAGVGDAPPLVAVQSTAQQSRLEGALDRPVEFVRDAPAYAGPLAGLVAAARAARTARIAVVGCDMPFVTTDAIRWLARQSATADVVVPVDRAGESYPVHAIYRTSELTARPVSERALKAVLDDLDVCRVPVERAPAPVSLQRSLTDVDTRTDLTAARRRCEPME